MYLLKAEKLMPSTGKDMGGNGTLYPRILTFQLDHNTELAGHHGQLDLSSQYPFQSPKLEVFVIPSKECMKIKLL
tara:strand:+ start:1888 stop:2112 length:225 start_codon:yes stop_codon:yes gene_type:complete